VPDLATVRALGFCVSVEHARYMARTFTEAGIPSVAVWGETPAEERHAALRDLADRSLTAVFSVDLFNEGVDVPSVDALLMLRPTDSGTLFLQQLGRGLRKDSGKAACTVLDFVGQHRREFRFDRRLGAVLGSDRQAVARQVEQGFPYLPAGCHMELDPVARDIVLQGIRAAIPERWNQKVDELLSLVATGAAPTLAAYLDHTGLDVADIYRGNRCWSDLLGAAEVQTAAAGPAEALLRRACGRLLHVDDEVRLGGYRDLVGMADPPRVDELDERDRRGVRMLVSQLVDQVPRELLPADASLQDGVDLVWRHPQVLVELAELFAVLDDQVDHIHERLPGRPDVPLLVHARYTRLEILSAFGHGTGTRVSSWQSGVMWLPDEQADLFAVTFDKTGSGFSPTTRYRDYAISPELFHWESQAATRAESPTGRRYQHHERQGSEVLIFARMDVNDRAFWCLGPAMYVEHDGERPMAITWRLRYPLPGDLFTQFAAAVA
jgi:hypothetical protein